MAQVDLLSAELAAIVVESAVYGIFLVLFVGCIYSLLHKRRRTRNPVHGKRINWPMLSVALILFVAITGHWIIDIRRLFLAFVITKDGPLAYYANLALPLDLARSALYVFEALVGDAIMIYRLWVVWNHKKAVVILPLCSLFGLVATGSGIVIEFHKLQPGQNPFGLASGRFITSSFVLTLVFVKTSTNIYSTSFITYKIWSVNKSMRSMGGSNLTSVIVIIAESAAVYTAWSFITLVTYLAKSNLQFTFLDMASPVVGAVFCLIIVRVSLGMSVRAFDTGTTTMATSNSGSWNEGTNSARSQGGFRLSPIRVNVHKHVDVGSAKDLGIPASDQKDCEVGRRYSSSLDAPRSQFEGV